MTDLHVQFTEALHAARQQLERIDQNAAASPELGQIEETVRGLLAIVGSAQVACVANYRVQEWSSQLREARGVATREVRYGQQAVRDAAADLAVLEIPPAPTDSIEHFLDLELRSNWRGMSGALRRGLVEQWAAGRERRALTALARSPLESEREAVVGAWREHGNPGKRAGAELRSSIGQSTVKAATALICAIDQLLAATARLTESIAPSDVSSLPVRHIGPAVSAA